MSIYGIILNVDGSFVFVNIWGGFVLNSYLFSMFVTHVCVKLSSCMCQVQLCLFSLPIQLLNTLFFVSTSGSLLLINGCHLSTVTNINFFINGFLIVKLDFNHTIIV